MRYAVGVVTAVACALLGGVLGLVGVVSHTRALPLVLLLVAVPSTAVALAPGWTRRVAFAGGWVGAVTVGLQQRPEGDYLIGRAFPSYLLLALTLALVLYAVVTLPVRGRRVPAEGAESVSDQP